MNIEEMAECLDRMERRLQTLEDLEAIKRLTTVYVNCLQDGDYSRIEDLFTEDALFTAAGPERRGKEDIGRFYRDVLAKIHSGSEGDILVQPVIDLDGDRAKGKWSIYFMYYHPITYQSLWFVQSWFDMDYKKEKGEWKISRLNILHHIEPPGGPPDEKRFLDFLDNARKTMDEMKRE